MHVRLHRFNSLPVIHEHSPLHEDAPVPSWAGPRPRSKWAVGLSVALIVILHCLGGALARLAEPRGSGQVHGTTELPLDGATGLMHAVHRKMLGSAGL